MGRRTKKPLGKAEIGLKAGRILGRYKMGKHFQLTIEDGRFAWARREEAIARECALDGIYIVRTNQPESQLSAADAAQVQKPGHRRTGLPLSQGGGPARAAHSPPHGRPREGSRLSVPARLLRRVAHAQALAPLLFHDEELDVDRARRDPVPPAQPSKSVRRKKGTRVADDGLPLHSFQTLLAELGTRCRNTAHLKTDGARTLQLVTALSPLQAPAFQLLGL